MTATVNRLRIVGLQASIVHLVCACSTTTFDGIQHLETDTLRLADGTLEQPVDMRMHASGRLVFLDAARREVVVLDTAGRVLARFGRRGAGPGELEAPRALHVSGDTVRVVDDGNGRIATYTIDGSFMGSMVVDAGVLRGPISILPDGSGIVGRNGEGSALAQLLDPKGRLGSRIGTPVVPPPDAWDLDAIKRQIWAGSVPSAIRNLVLPIAVAPGDYWLLLQSEGKLQRFNGAGALKADGVLPQGDADPIRQDFFERNRRDSSDFRFHVLAYFADAVAVGDELWVLLRQPERLDAEWLIIDRNAIVRRKARATGAHGVRRIAVSPGARLVYLLVPGEGTLLVARAVR